MQNSVKGIYASGISKYFLRDHDLYNPHILKVEGDKITPGDLFSSNLAAISESHGVIGRALVTFPEYDQRRRRRRGEGVRGGHFPPIFLVKI
jgi:hypothetical protein